MAQTNVQTFSGNVGVGTGIPSSVFNTYGGALSDGGDTYTSKVAATFQVGRGGGSQAADQGTGAILELRHESDYRHVTIESVSESTNSGDIGLRFKTTTDSNGPQERMRIDGDGNVGIGTNNPKTRLNITSVSSKDNNMTSLRSNAAIRVDTAGDYNDFLSIGIFDTDTPDDNNPTGYIQHSWDSNSDVGRPFVINPAGGNVGIGTNNPASDLHVQGASGELFRYTDGSRTVYGGCTSDSLGAFFGTSTNHMMRFVSNGTTRMTVAADGNVGIGTTDPIGKLDVRGAIIAPVVGYLANQDAPYLITGTSGYTGAATNWNTHGFQHRIKTNSGGVPRITVDAPSGGEVFSIVNGGNVGIGIASPACKLDIAGEDFMIRGNTPSLNFSEGASGMGGGFRIRYDGANQADGNNFLAIQTGTNFATTSIHCNLTGNVGIGTTNPLRRFHVNGSTDWGAIRTTNTGATSAILVDNSSQGTGVNDFSYLFNGPRPGTSSGGAVGFINSANRSADGAASAYTIRNDSGELVIGHNSHVTNLNGSITQKVNGNSSFILFGPNSSYNSRLYVGATGGGPFPLNGPNGGDAGVVTTNGNLHLDASGPATGGRAIYLNHYSGNLVVYKSSTIHGSDDRIKTQEKFIQNSLPIIKKLKPQTYLHHRELNSTDCRFSSGLIAQEVYYNCPELRHIVNVPRSAYVDLTKEFPDDPSIDPDYSDWGDEIAAVNYIEIIPYLIGAINQLSNEGIRHKVKVSNLSFSNVLEYHGLVVSKNSNVYISNIENDKRVYGVISDVKAETNDNEVLVNYRGNGKIWVINADNIQAGDYITTSNVSGYAMKQEEDDTLKNYTIAKSSIDCDFTPPMIDEKRIVQTNTTTSRWKYQSNVVVSESTYSNLSDDVKYTESRVMYKEIDGDNLITPDVYNTSDIITQNNYTQTTVTEYYYMSTRYLDYDPDSSGNDWIEESISKTVDSLDENGQVIWENTGTQVPLYPIKYITSSGTETDLSNAVYTAALIDCSILGG